MIQTKEIAYRKSDAGRIARSGPQTGTARLAKAGLQTAAFQFIPVPYVDDWLIARRRRKMVRQLLERQGFTFERKSPAIFCSWINRSTLSRLGSATRKLLTKPVRKLFRTVFFWFTVRSSLRTLAETYFLGRFVDHPAVGNFIAGNDGHLDRTMARFLAEVFAEQINRIDWKIARQGSERAWRLLQRLKRSARSEFASTDLEKVIDAELPGILQQFDSAVATSLEMKLQ